VSASDSVGYPTSEYTFRPYLTLSYTTHLKQEYCLYNSEIAKVERGFPLILWCGPKYLNTMETYERLAVVKKPTTPMHLLKHTSDHERSITVEDGGRVIDTVYFDGKQYEGVTVIQDSVGDTVIVKPFDEDGEVYEEEFEMTELVFNGVLSEKPISDINSCIVDGLVEVGLVAISPNGGG